MSQNKKKVLKNLPLPALFLIIEFSTNDSVLSLLQSTSKKLKNDDHHHHHHPLHDVVLEAISCEMNKKQFEFILPISKLENVNLLSSISWFSFCRNHFQVIFGKRGQTAREYEDAAKNKLEFLGFSMKTAEPIWSSSHSQSSLSLFNFLKNQNQNQQNQQQHKRKWKLFFEDKFVFTNSKDDQNNNSNSSQNYYNSGEEKRFGALLGRGSCEEVSPQIIYRRKEKNNFEFQQLQRKNHDDEKDLMKRNLSNNNQSHNDDTENDEESSIVSSSVSSRKSIDENQQFSKNDDNDDQNGTEKNNIIKPRILSFVSVTIFVETPSGIAQLICYSVWNNNNSGNSLEDFWWTFHCTGGDEEVLSCRDDSRRERDFFIASPQQEILGEYYKLSRNKQEEKQKQQQTNEKELIVNADEIEKLVLFCCSSKNDGDDTKTEDVNVLEEDCSCFESVKKLIDFCSSSSSSSSSSPSSSSLLNFAHEHYFNAAREAVQKTLIDQNQQVVSAKEIVKVLQTPKGNWPCSSGTFKVHFISPLVHVDFAEQSFQTFIKRNWERGVCDFFESGLFPIGFLNLLLTS